MENNDRHEGLKIWCWIIGILAIAILSVITFCHIVYWLIWIGAFTVIALIFALIILVYRIAHRIEDRRSDE